VIEDSARGRKTGWFTLQWHLTHACDMDCKHCYDRRRLSVLRLDEAMRVLDEVQAFCEKRGVEPSMSLSGGNPFLYPWFFDVYEEVVKRGMHVNILGNPVAEEQIERLVSIKVPRYYQISLEGLREHNDEIRGEGSFDRALAFLPILKKHGIRRIVMLTLTKANLDQVIPLGELLQGKADRFTFNRLSQTGEGANLELPDIETYGRFMIDYMAAKKRTPVLGFKDNLFNIYRHELGMKLQGGCTGFGCGAAFNFVCLLPDGDVHACRKLPSALGNVRESSLEAIYESQMADRYRAGCEDCKGCPIFDKCGGCLAVTAGQGGDRFKERDPHCFI